jgi:hypothetical protein
LFHQIETEEVSADLAQIKPNGPIFLLLLEHPPRIEMDRVNQLTTKKVKSLSGSIQPKVGQHLSLSLSFATF